MDSESDVIRVPRLGFYRAAEAQRTPYDEDKYASSGNKASDDRTRPQHGRVHPLMITDTLANRQGRPSHF